MRSDWRKKYFVGKVSDKAQKKGWFFGHFMNEKLLNSDLVEVAWQDISGKKPDPQDKHYHKKSVEINIILSGWMKLNINGQRVRAGKGEFYVIYPESMVEEVEAGENTELMVVRAPSIARDKFQL